MVEVILLGLNDIGERIYEWLVDRRDAEVEALFTEPNQLKNVEVLQPELIISAGFRYIVQKEILNVPDLGSVNLHKAYLPFNRGANPNVWSIVEDTPAGVTLHYMTEDLDAGPIIDRRMVEKRPEDTAKDLYERLEKAQFDQFKEMWPDIRDNSVDTETVEEEGTYHYKRDFVDLWELNLGETAEVGEFINRLRGTTFPPFRNAYFVEDNTRYFVDIHITPEGEADSDYTRKIPEYTEEEQP